MGNAGWASAAGAVPSIMVIAAAAAQERTALRLKALRIDTVVPSEKMSFENQYRAAFAENERKLGPC